MENRMQSKFTLLNDQHLMEFVLEQPILIEYAVRPPVLDIDVDAYWLEITRKYNEKQNELCDKEFLQEELKARWEMLLKLIQTKENILKTLAFPLKMCELINMATDLLKKYENDIAQECQISTPPYQHSETISCQQPTMTNSVQLLRDNMAAIQALPWKERCGLIAEICEVALQTEIKVFCNTDNLNHPVFENVMGECDRFFKKVNVTEELPDDSTDIRPMLTNLTAAYTNQINTCNNVNTSEKSTSELTAATTSASNNSYDNMLVGVENITPSLNISIANGISVEAVATVQAATHAPLAPLAPSVDVQKPGDIEEATVITESPPPFMITDVRSLRDIVLEAHKNHAPQTEVVPNNLPTVINSNLLPVANLKPPNIVEAGETPPPNFLITNVRSLRKASDHLKTAPIKPNTSDVVPNCQSILPAVAKITTVTPPPLLIRNVANLRRDQLRAIINGEAEPKQNSTMISIPLNTLNLTSPQVEEINNTSLKHFFMNIGSPVVPVATAATTITTDAAPVETQGNLAVMMKKNITEANEVEPKLEKNNVIPSIDGSLQESTATTNTSVQHVQQANMAEIMVNENSSVNTNALNVTNEPLLGEQDQLTEEIKRIIGSTKIEDSKRQKRKSPTTLTSIDMNALKIPRLEAEVVEKEQACYEAKVQVEEIMEENPQLVRRSLRSDSKNISIIKNTDITASQNVVSKKKILYEPYIPSHRSLPVRSCKNNALKKLNTLPKFSPPVRKFHIRVKRDFKDHKPLQLTRSQANALKMLHSDLVNT